MSLVAVGMHADPEVTSVMGAGHPCYIHWSCPTCRYQVVTDRYAGPPADVFEMAMSHLDECRQS